MWELLIGNCLEFIDVVKVLGNLKFNKKKCKCYEDYFVNEVVLFLVVKIEEIIVKVYERVW